MANAHPPASISRIFFPHQPARSFCFKTTVCDDCRTIQFRPPSGWLKFLQVGKRAQKKSRRQNLKNEAPIKTLLNTG
jgi:hypothetical protein